MRRDRDRQGGYALLELTLALLVLGLLAVLGSRTLANRLNDAQAQSAAVWMSAVHKAVLGYVQRHGPAIQEADDDGAVAVPGYADWRSPTLAELKQAGLLSSGMPETSRLTGGAAVQVWRKGDCPGDDCVVEALVHGEQPLLNAAGRPDEALTGQWLLAAGGEGAAVHQRDPERIRGAAFSFSATLPDNRVLPVGTVGMAVTAEHQALWSFLRVGDQRDPRFQGQVSLEKQLVIGAHEQSGRACTEAGAVVNETDGGLLVCRNGVWRSVSRMAGGYSQNVLYDCALPDGTSTANPLTNDCSCPEFAAAVPIFDSGPRPGLEGRQIAYLCVG